MPLSSSNLEEQPFFLSVPASTFLSYISSNNSLDAPALIYSKLQHICNFNSSLAQLKLEECATCNEIFFDIKLSNRIRKACCDSNIQQKLYSKSNNKDNTFIPYNLSYPSEVEEILI